MHQLTNLQYNGSLLHPHPSEPNKTDTGLFFSHTLVLRRNTPCHCIDVIFAWGDSLPLTISNTMLTDEIRAVTAAYIACL